MRSSEASLVVHENKLASSQRRRCRNAVVASKLRESTQATSVVLDDASRRSESLAPTRFAMALLVAFSSIAVVLSAIGLYGVIAYSVSQRTREIGVRMAMGADARSVRQLIVGDGLRLAALGVVLGISAAIASTRALAGLLYGVSPEDPASFIAIVVLVVGIAAVASYMPARRAMRIDPTEALRAD